MVLRELKDDKQLKIRVRAVGDVGKSAWATLRSVIRTTRKRAAQQQNFPARQHARSAGPVASLNASPVAHAALAVPDAPAAPATPVAPVSPPTPPTSLAPLALPAPPAAPAVPAAPLWVVPPAALCFF